MFVLLYTYKKSSERVKIHQLLIIFSTIFLETDHRIRQIVQMNKVTLSACALHYGLRACPAVSAPWVLGVHVHL